MHLYPSRDPVTPAIHFIKFRNFTMHRSSLLRLRRPLRDKASEARVGHGINDHFGT